MEGKIPLTQIYRNFLLSEMYGLRGHDEKLESYSIILAPKRLRSTEKELESLTNGLRDEYKEKIKNIHLEDFVNAIIANCPDEYRGDFERFYDRYLNFDKLKNIE
jgi:FMN phosphatase YigB (HAD superfamily)